MRDAFAQKDHAWHFYLPWMIGFLLMYAIPISVGVALAMTKWDGVSWESATWVGLEHFEKLLFDAQFGGAVEASFRYSILNVTAQLLVALGLAALVRRASRSRGMWATIFYTPHLLSGVATILIWWWILNPNVGPINRVLMWVLESANGGLTLFGLDYRFTIEGPSWLFSADWARPSVVLMNLWQAGGPMLIFLAAMLRSDRTLDEAATIDGAGAIRRFIVITIPQISPAILFNLLTVFVASIQSFEPAFLLSNWEQGGALQFATLEIYQTAFERQQLSYALAESIALMLVLTIACLGIIVVTRKQIVYDFGIEAGS